ncbi:MAG: hypothetical protein KZQ81_16105, partial [Candidatus Thiodiazotropha sp. (ex Rostrolucina anterorostrata)]|nr:hypothetical protein [Candidatus Thiodiazotropha sp. (ex Rostrolucina anterorostrata)]
AFGANSAILGNIGVLSDKDGLTRTTTQQGALGFFTNPCSVSERTQWVQEKCTIFIWRIITLRQILAVNCGILI